MTIVNMHQAKTGLSGLVEQVETGKVKEVILARNGTPVARIVPLDGRKPKIRLGLAAGRYPHLSLEDFDSSNAEIAKLFGVEDP